jgi:aldehyde dehydrogenase family 7 protein A1
VLKASHPNICSAFQIDGEMHNGVYTGKWSAGKGQVVESVNPSNGEVIGKTQLGTVNDLEEAIAAMDNAKKSWANVPAPQRGELVRKIGEKIRLHKEELGMLVSLENGKIYAEGLGEVQEAIDICDFAVGLSRSLNGSVIPSERPGHFMMERYNPLKGHVGIISAFNFPVAVYFWNLALSLVAGNTNLWKPHEAVSLTSIAVSKIVSSTIEESGYDGAIASMVLGDGKAVGDALVNDPRFELVSFTGSTAVGRHVSQVVAKRFGKQILELGGNNSMIVDKSADLDMALRATLFGAVGTAGQRCTTQRRVFLHKDIYDEFLAKLLPAYKSVHIGSALDPKTLCGPLINKAAVETFKDGVKNALENGGEKKVYLRRMLVECAQIHTSTTLR